MKSQLPSGVSGFRGQGPGTEQSLPPAHLDRAASAVGWHRANAPIPQHT